MRIKVISIIIVIIIIAFLAWLFWASTRPLPGQKQTDEGRGHVQIGTEISYKTNPPTSGQHYGDWVRAGIFSEPKDDRNLVHSLEHGYIVMSYRCNQGNQGNKEDKVESTDSSPRTVRYRAQNDRQEDCDERKAKLEEIYNKKDKRKLIVVVRPNLDTNFAMTAWNYLDKFDPSTGSGLSDFDVKRIEKFIDAHRDNGPERTME